MNLDRSTQLINGIQQISSPNFDDRPLGVEPEVIIIHAISLPPGNYGGNCIESLSCNTLIQQVHDYFA
ncbi:MAG: 1,6-anhydro-N-acetylmuramyl-L-alanine amidase AmpD, partial [Proteobacteria bacterium]|nr:1,6-anhydro-N-acetylmuramyl-L-alanine amidase AmpD [Pseudomonadota bacterium]